MPVVTRSQTKKCLAVHKMVDKKKQQKYVVKEKFDMKVEVEIARIAIKEQLKNYKEMMDTLVKNKDMKWTREGRNYYDVMHRIFTIIPPEVVYPLAKEYNRILEASFYKAPEVFWSVWAETNSFMNKLDILLGKEVKTCVASSASLSDVKDKAVAIYCDL